jgi:xanthine dehydrogenase accessory factor
MNHLARAHQLTGAGTSFAIATVVRCDPPASARPGAKAIVRRDGTIEGWVGGSCAQDLVAREAQRAIETGTPRLLRLSPSAGAESRQRADVVEYLMTCHSGGTLEIFIEPIVPAPLLRLVGETPIVETLATLGQTLGYRVEHSDRRNAIETPSTLEQGPAFVVVATMGTADEEAIEAALRSDAPYVALVASPRRAAVMRDYLTARGITSEQLARLKAPAGLDLGSQRPEEIALSIMAEIVQVRSRMTDFPTPRTAEPTAEAIDPVCGMTVTTRDARHFAEHEGTTYYFCCPHCRAAFERNPGSFTTVGAGAGVPPS